MRFNSKKTWETLESTHSFRTIIPAVFAILTQYPRQIITDPEWSESSWVYNAFRFYELIFGRRAGIRAESTVSAVRNNGAIHIVRYFHTVEAALAHIEGAIRSFKFIPFRLYIPMLATPVGSVPASPYLFAIAWGTSTGDTTGGPGPLTYSHTVSGSNTILWAATSTRSNPAFICNGITYAASSLTQIGTGTGTFEFMNVQLFYKIAPATGANNVVASYSSGGTPAECNSTSFSGALQSGVPDSSNTGSRTSAATSLTVATTVVAANCWIVTSNGGLGQPNLSGTNATLRSKAAPNALGGIFDSNGTVSTGSVSVTVNETSSNSAQGMVVASFAPAPIPKSGFLMFM